MAVRVNSDAIYLSEQKTADSYKLLEYFKTVKYSSKPNLF